MLAWVALANYREDTEGSRRPYRAIAGVTSEAQSAQVGRLLAEAHGVLRSAVFEGNLRSLAEAYPKIYARPGQQEATANDLADYISLKRPGARYVVVDAFLLSDDEAVDGMLASAGEGMAGVGRFADITLDAVVPRLFASADIVAQSCAINAAAHEYSHTISTLPIRYQPAFTDTTAEESRIGDRRHPGTPVASYLIGAVAQCTWLQTRGRIGKGDLRACVEVFGTNRFNLQRCGAFSDGQAVALRPDLPAVGPGL